METPGSLGHDAMRVGSAAPVVAVTAVCAVEAGHCPIAISTDHEPPQQMGQGPRALVASACSDLLCPEKYLALPGGKGGLNDRGSKESMSTIEKRVTAFHDWLRNDQVLQGKECYRNLIVQLEQYWDKLFCDPIVVETPKGTITIQPQRTNNLMLPAGFQNPQDPSETILGCTKHAFAS